MTSTIFTTEDSNIPVDDSGLGLVYLLKRNHNSTIIKIGYTAKTAESRALNYTDGEWVVHKEYFMPVWLAKMTERAAHSKLEQFWLDPKLTGGSASEIFTCSLEEGDISIQLAYIEQLEKSLRLLGVPKEIANIVLKERGLSGNLTPSKIEEHLKLLSREQQREKDSLIQRIDALKGDLSSNEQKSIHALKINEGEIKALLEKISSLETELIVLKHEIRESTSDFSLEFDILERTADKKINVKDFEALRDGFRKAVDIIRTLRLRHDSHP